MKYRNIISALSVTGGHELSTGLSTKSTSSSSLVGSLTGSSSPIFSTDGEPEGQGEGGGEGGLFTEGEGEGGGEGGGDGELKSFQAPGHGRSLGGLPGRCPAAAGQLQTAAGQLQIAAADLFQEEQISKVCFSLLKTGKGLICLSQQICGSFPAAARQVPAGCRTAY